MLPASTMAVLDVDRERPKSGWGPIPGYLCPCPQNSLNNPCTCWPMKLPSLWKLTIPTLWGLVCLQRQPTLCGVCFSQGCSHFLRWTAYRSTYRMCISLNKSTSYLPLCLSLYTFCTETWRTWASITHVVSVGRWWVCIPPEMQRSSSLIWDTVLLGNHWQKLSALARHHITACMSCLTNGGRIREGPKGGRRHEPVIYPTSLPETLTLEFTLADRCLRHQEGPESSHIRATSKMIGQRQPGKLIPLP